MKVHITDKRTKVKVSKRDLWNLDITLSKVILPCLKKFRDELSGWPSILPLVEENADGTASDEQAMEAWRMTLDQMINGFEKHLDGAMWSSESRQDVQKALDLFAKYYTHLWN